MAVQTERRIKSADSRRGRKTLAFVARKRGEVLPELNEGKRSNRRGVPATLRKKRGFCVTGASKGGRLSPVGKGCGVFQGGGES